MKNVYGSRPLGRPVFWFPNLNEDLWVLNDLLHSPAIYLLYAKLEEEYGLARHAMAVYERSTQAVEPEERHLMFNIYIKRAAEIYGVTHTRAIYQKAIEVWFSVYQGLQSNFWVHWLTLDLNYEWDQEPVLGGEQKYSSQHNTAAKFNQDIYL